MQALSNACKASCSKVTVWMAGVSLPSAPDVPPSFLRQSNSVLLSECHHLSLLLLGGLLLLYGGLGPPLPPLGGRSCCPCLGYEGPGEGSGLLGRWAFIWILSCQISCTLANAS